MSRGPEVILATDLDGTFLGGDEAEQRTLYEILRRNSTHKLIFVTGRGIESVIPLLSDPRIPAPHYIIADVGATVVHGSTLEPVQPLQTELAKRWPGTYRVLEAVARYDYLELQQVPQERRCSFLASGDDIDDGLREAVARLGCELLFSAGRYLDVLPRGVDKGSTLRALIDQERFDADRVVVAGDTLNDLSLFTCGLKGIVVGEAEPALAQRVRESAAGSRTYLAARPGAGGILEGLHYYGLLKAATARLAHLGEEVADGAARGPDDRPEAEADAPASEPPGCGIVEGTRSAPIIEAPRTAPPSGEAQLVMVYHRQPFDEIVRDGRIHRRRPRSPNGIIPTLLGFFAGGRSGSWVAWSKQPSRSPPDFEARVPVDPERYPHLTAARIPLTAEDVRLFYETFSKEAFWPIIFSFPDKAVFDEAHWLHYLEINRLFAERAAEEAKEDALVWIHDYNLWMVPAFLRQLRPDLRISFFHHTAFPASDIFNVIPWRRELVSSLLSCDYVGFHIPRYVENFLDVVRSHTSVEVMERIPCAPRYLTYGCALGVDTMATTLKAGDHTVRVGAHPVGIDVEAIEKITARPDVREKIATISHEIGSRTCILSVERLDYVKGPLEKLHAFERLLEEHPELHREIVLVTICTPPAPGMKIYRQIRERVDEAVGRINGRFSRLDWVPVRYFFRSLPFEDVIAYYAVADIAWITPLRDGLNLVAKEFVSTNAAEKGDGVLVLSEFAGAAVELHGAVLTNPYHTTSMSESLYRALTMQPEDRRARLRTMAEIVRAYDIREWGRDFMEAAAGRD